MTINRAVRAQGKTSSFFAKSFLRKKNCETDFCLGRPFGDIFGLATLKMEDESGIDAKLIAVPVEKLCPMYKAIQKMEDLPELLLSQISHFFEHYKDLEKGKWVKVEGWENAEAAKAEIVASFERAKNK